MSDQNSIPEELVILVNEQDEQIGTLEKMEAHRRGLLHRAFSVLVFNSRNELLLQQRALSKYHSGGLWTNTCCSHPRPEEQNEDAALRRLKEEMGMQCDLKHFSSFIYKTELDHGLTEHEYDHIFIGYTDDQPLLNPEEVMDYRYASMEELKKDVAENHENYTVWFRLMFSEVYRFIMKD